jgi:YfiH family protein
VASVAPEVEARRRAVVDLEWTWLRQVHGTTVAQVEAPGGQAGAKADAAVARIPSAALAVLAADCAPVALAADAGVIGVAHAGWRGLAAGVLEAAVGAMRDLGAGDVVAALGPCIHAECYEFGEDDLDTVAARLGDVVRATTATGRPALDVPAAVVAALGAAGVTEVQDVDVCTACSPDYFSWRARRDTGRQAAVVWR